MIHLHAALFTTVVVRFMITPVRNAENAAITPKPDLQL